METKSVGLLLSAPVPVALCHLLNFVIFSIRFGVGVLHKNSSLRVGFRENRPRDSHMLLTAVK